MEAGPAKVRFGARPPRNPQTRLITNAQMETVTAKPTWREAVSRGRVAVPLAEWVEYDRRTRHTWWAPPRHGAWAAGIHIRGGFAVLTRPAGPILAHMHHRQPALVPDPHAWIAPGSVGEALARPVELPVGGIGVG